MNRNENAVAYHYHAAADGSDDIRPLGSSFEAHATLVGVTLGKLYADHGGRDGLDAMLDDATRGEFGVLLIEHPDHLSRNPLELARLIETLEAHGVGIEQVGHGRIGIRDVTLAGLRESEAREIMRQRTRFELNWIARQGLVPGGRTYGYQPVAGEPGRRVVVEAEAVVVRAVFAMHLEGRGAQRIAQELNLRRDTGRVWTRLSVDRLLRTELYNGVLVYGRRQRSIDRSTGRVRMVRRPRSAWVVTAVEGLRIVTTAMWDAAQALLKAR